MKNLPTNIVATSAEHDIAGSLLGRPVTVRFTPAGYTFDHGDGTARDSATGGRSWEQLREPQFAATDTSHVYTQRGTFALTVTARYTAAVNFGDGVWRSVDGTVAAPGPTQPIQIFEARTALVQYTCIQKPSAPGC